jgi:hypothetical protein
MKLIRNSLIAFLLLMVLCETLTRYVYQKLAFQDGENQSIHNYIVAQKYIYDHADALAVIAGSSLSMRLHSDLLSPETFNLSFGGLTSLDGVNIVLGAHTHPRAVFIESNSLIRNSDPDFDNGMLSPWLLAARRWMTSLRDFARPVTLVQTYLRVRIDRTSAFLVRHSPTDVQSATSKVNEKVIFDQLLANQKRNFAAPLSKDAQAKLITELGADIAALQQRDIKVVFFELPTNSALCEMPRYTSIRNLVRTQFPAQPYFRIGDCNAVTTADSLHLTGPEAEPVTRQFAEIVRQTIY